MKPYIIISISFLFFSFLCFSRPVVEIADDGGGDTDSLALMLENYLGALEYESLETKISECDFLISVCSDPEIRSEVALRIYDHYLQSDLMGVEAVSVHIYDRWFSTGKVKVEDDVLFGARIFAEFNRQSLLGNKAPDLRMCTPSGDSLSVTGSGSASGRYKILYFYDVDCPKCFVESARMPVLIKKDFPVDLYAIYVGVDSKAWEDYRERFSLDVRDMRVVHLWDENLDSDYQRKYGILQTPGLFLVDPMGVIAGRRLDVATLTAMLQLIFEEKEMEYGSEKSVRVFDETFAPYGDGISMENIRFVADYIEKSTVGHADTLMFKQLSGDLLYYLIPKKGQVWKEGLQYVIDDKILSRPDVWDSSDDSLKVVGAAKMMEELLGLSPKGSELPSIKLPAVLLRHSASGRIKEKESEFNIRRIGGQKNLIVFWTEGCENCKVEKKALHELLSSSEGRGLRVLEVNMDEIFSSCPSIADELLACFDLSSMPYIISADRKGRVTGRYLSFARQD